MSDKEFLEKIKEILLRSKTEEEVGHWVTWLAIKNPNIFIKDSALYDLSKEIKNKRGDKVRLKIQGYEVK